MLSVVPDGGFAEGSVDPFTDEDVWFCFDHSTKVKVGKDCLFCLYNEVGDSMFDNIEKITLP